MNLFKTSFYTSISTAVTFFSGFITVKIIAVKLGPEGVSQLGQFQNTISLLSIAATLSISLGVTKYLAEFHDSAVYQKKLITTSIITVLLGAVITSLFTIVFSRYLSNKAFHNETYTKVFILFGLLLTCSALNTLFSAFLNGIRDIKKLTIINITTSIVSLTLTVVLANFFGLFGVLAVSSITALFIFIINIWFLRKTKYIHLNISLADFDSSILKKLLTYSTMSAVALLLVPINQLFIRDYIINNQGFTNAGYWQSVTKISDYYLMFVTSAFGVYFLPVFSSIKDNGLLKKELLKGYKIIIPSVFIMSSIIFLCRNLIIQILFTREFQPMEPLFLFQLIGDFLKIGSWLLGYLLAAKALIKITIYLEIITSVSLILLTRYFIGHYGVIGAMYAFALNYALYWLALAIITKVVIFKKNNKTSNLISSS